MIFVTKVVRVRMNVFNLSCFNVLRFNIFICFVLNTKNFTKFLPLCLRNGLLFEIEKDVSL